MISKRQNFLAFMFLVVFAPFLFSPYVLAGEMVHHHDISSPFDKQVKGHIAHCDLKKHLVEQFYCPHRSNVNTQVKLVIAPYCNGQTSKNIPPLSLNNSSHYFLYPSFFTTDFNLISKLFTFMVVDTQFFLPVSIDHPPSFI